MKSAVNQKVSVSLQRCGLLFLQKSLPPTSCCLVSAARAQITRSGFLCVSFLIHLYKHCQSV